MFTDTFGRYVCDGDNITCKVDGFVCTATVHHDPHMGEPWKEHDGHGPVSEWVRREKLPGERILARDRSSYRYYDFKAAVATAREEGWDAEPYGHGTPGERAARAAEHDFKVLKAWCDDEWSWYGVTVTVSKNGVSLTDEYDHAVWGIEGNYPGSDNSYFVETANELLADAIDAARVKLATLCECDELIEAV